MAKKGQPVSTSTVSFWHNDRNVGLLLGAFAFLLYAQTIGFGYALDDRAVLYSNKFVTDGFGGFGKILTTFYWAGFWESNAGLFRPVSLLLFATEWQLFPNNTTVFHFVHIVLYAVTSYQLYRFLRELLSESNHVLPFIATLIWIALPVHAEVAANLKSADEILSLMFGLLSARYLLKWESSAQLKPLMLSSVFLFLALLSKEGAVLFYPVLLLVLFQWRNRNIKEIIRPALVLFIPVLVWLLWHTAVIASAPTGMIEYDYHNNALLSSDSSIDRLGTAIGMQFRYWQKIWIGYPLSYNYSFNEIPVIGFSDPYALISLAVILAAIFIAYRTFRTEPLISFSVLFYLITFALTSNIFYLIGDTMADRLTFVPSVGAALLTSALLMKLTKTPLKTASLSSSAAMLTIVLTLIYSVRTYARSSDWKDESTLFTVDVDHAPGSARVHYNYGVLLLEQAGKETDEVRKKQLWQESLNQYKQAYTIDSLDVQSYFNAGVAEFRLGNYASSVEYFRKVRKITPADMGVMGNMGDAFIKVQQFDSAVTCYQLAIDAKLGTEEIWNGLGGCYLMLGDTAKAIVTFEQSVKLFPKGSKGWDKLANVCGMAGKFERTTEAFLKLTELNPQDPSPWKMIATNYLVQGDTVNASKYWVEYQKRGGK